MKKLIALIGMGIIVALISISSTQAGYVSTKLEVRENRLEMKLNQNEFRQEYLGTINDTVDSLSFDQKEQLIELNDEFRADIYELQLQNTGNLSFYEREHLFGEMKEVLALYIGQVLFVVDGNEDAVNYVEDWYGKFQKNEELREENRKNINDFINEVIDFVEEMDV